MSIQEKNTPGNLIQGINKTTTFKTPNQTTFALNAIKDSHEGGKFEYQSEPGNELVESLPTGYQLLGYINGINNEIYLFAVKNESISMIGIFREGKFTIVVDNVDLGFNSNYPVTGEFRIRNGCERVITFCDGNSADKWFNFDNQELFKDGVNWDANKFNFIPKIVPPKIDLVAVNDFGGQLQLGSYYFQLEVLDANQNVIYKTDITPQTIVYDESVSDNYYNIDGGLNAPQYDTAIGGVPITNKSITLRFYNLDTNFASLRVNVARQLAGTQVIDAHAVSQLIPIDSESKTWTYIGYNVNAGDFPIDYTSMLINNSKYESAYVMEQVQNRLLRANLKQSIKNYSEYQKKATLITATWNTKTCLLEETKEVTPFVSSVGSPKNPLTYWEARGFQGDEIYHFGIRYLHDDGEWSPVFPLIGRNPVAFDLEELTVVDNSTSPLGSDEVWLSDVEHIDSSEFSFWNGDYVGSQIPRWKVFNTASQDDLSFGYYECDATYPNIQSCDGELVWGTDADGNEIFTDTKIRLFRFPDRRNFPHFVKGTVDGEERTLGFIFGVQFDNIEYPDTNIIGHQFCYVKRDEFNKTVVDSGWLGKPPIDEEELFLLSTFNSDDDSEHTYGRFNSTKLLFNSNLTNPDYIKINRAFRGESELVNNDEYFEYPSKLGDDLGTLRCHIYHIDYADNAETERTNYKVINEIFTPLRTLTDVPTFPVKIANFNGLSSDSVVAFNYELEDLEPLLAAESTSLPNPGSGDPFTIQYSLNVRYCYKKSNVKPYERVTDLSYSYINFNYVDSTDPSDNLFFGGDTLIVQSAPLREVRFFFGENNADQYWNALWYKMFWEEQQINSSLRHGGIEPAFTYYKGNKDTSHFIYKISTLINGNRYELFPREVVVNSTFQIERIIPEYYAYNKDYDLQSNQQYKTNLPFNYDYCSDCLGRYTNRIIFSPRSFDEEVFDLYRVNLTNDYIDIPGHRGAITGLKYKNNQLLVHCEDGTFILRPNPQALATDQASVYLTTGDFLSIPPVEMLQTDMGYAGCQSKQHQCDTPFGWCWIDQRRGEIFKFDNQLSNLSNIGLEQWFKENLPSETKKAIYQAYEIDYPYTATMNLKGHGIIVYYDPRFKRLIISKKDYLPINLAPRVGEEGVIWSPEFDLWLSVTDDGEIGVTYGNENNFENKSWTLSFDLITNTWCSWHSYIPVFAFFDEMNYYTTPLEVISANKIWRHKDKQKYQEYYSVKYDMIVEWMNFDVETDTYYGLNYTGYSLQWDSVNKQWKTVDATFDRGVFYNFDQSSGLVNLVLQNQHTNPYDNITLSPATKYVIKTDQNYKISGIYDIATDTPVQTNNWDELKLYGSYIDVVPNSANLDNTQSNYYTGNIWDKFIINRLFYKPEQDYKKVLILTVTKEHKSIR